MIICLVVAACYNNAETNRPKVDQVSKIKNQGHQLVYDMVKKVGSYEDLLKKHDVTYTYTYQTPDGKADISTEKYRFDGAYSYGKYLKHERTLPQLAGVIEQGFDGQSYWLKQNGKQIKNPDYLKRVAFNRPTNFYWFTMMQKLLDPGLIYEYLGPKTIDNKEYEIVKISFESKDGKPKDIYQIYINKQTLLVDQFLFTVADFGVMDPKLMEIEYEEIDGLLIPTKRRYKNSNWEAEVTDEPWIKVEWSNIKFKNGFGIDDFKL